MVRYGGMKEVDSILEAGLLVVESSDPPCGLVKMHWLERVWRGAAWALSPCQVLWPGLCFGFDDGNDAGGPHLPRDQGADDGGHGPPSGSDGAARHSPGKALQGLVLGAQRV